MLYYIIKYLQSLKWEVKVHGYPCTLKILCTGPQGAGLPFGPTVKGGVY